MGRHGLGEFEEQVLLAVHRLQGQGYAVTIRSALKDRIGRIVSLGAAYSTLDRLERKGMISSRLADPTPERGGRAKRLYRIEAPGLLALGAARKSRELAWEGLPPLAGRPT